MRFLPPQPQNWYAIIALERELDDRHCLQFMVIVGICTVIGAFSGSGLLQGYPAVEEH